MKARVTRCQFDVLKSAVISGENATNFVPLPLPLLLIFRARTVVTEVVSDAENQPELASFL